MKGYWIATYSEIKDPERMKKYADKAKEAVLKHSGKILARSANTVSYTHLTLPTSDLV